jgi:hypothetical protein
MLDACYTKKEAINLKLFVIKGAKGKQSSIWLPYKILINCNCTKKQQMKKMV